MEINKWLKEWIKICAYARVEHKKFINIKKRVFRLFPLCVNARWYENLNMRIKINKSEKEINIYGEERIAVKLTREIFL